MVAWLLIYYLSKCSRACAQKIVNPLASIESWRNQPGCAVPLYLQICSCSITLRWNIVSPRLKSRGLIIQYYKGRLRNLKRRWSVVWYIVRSVTKQSGRQCPRTFVRFWLEKSPSGQNHFWILRTSSTAYQPWVLHEARHLLTLSPIFTRLFSLRQ